MSIEIVVRFPVDDVELSRLHARAFGTGAGNVTPWARRLEKHALTWVGAFEGGRLVGFVQVCWDGGEHAMLLDTAVDPRRQRLGIGVALVRAAAQEATRAGCGWLHVDFEEDLTHFYRDRCGFRGTPAGLLRLS